MPEPLLTDVFGANATQSATQLIIDKQDLVSTGLTPSANNTAESLMVALILKAEDKLNPDNQETDPDIQVTIADSNFPQIVFRNDTNYRQITYNVNLQIVDTGASVDPDNY